MKICASLGGILPTGFSDRPGRSSWASPHGRACWLDRGFELFGRLLIFVLFGINIVFHMLWSPLFFNLKRPDWALIEVPFLWLSIAALMFGVAPFSSLAVWLLLPYLSGWPSRPFSI